MLKPLLVVAGALLDDSGRVLAQQRPVHKQHGGLWEFPGGKVEPGETPETALARELSEELGITLALDALSPAGFATVPGIVLLLYAVRVWQGEPVAVEGTELRWVTPHELEYLPMPPADVPLVAVIRDLLVRSAPNRSGTAPRTVR